MVRVFMYLYMAIACFLISSTYLRTERKNGFKKKIQVPIRFNLKILHKERLLLQFWKALYYISYSSTDYTFNILVRNPSTCL